RASARRAGHSAGAQDEPAGAPGDCAGGARGAAGRAGRGAQERGEVRRHDGSHGRYHQAADPGHCRMSGVLTRKPLAATLEEQLRSDLPSTAASDVPAALLPYQQAWLADQSDFKVCEKSRRTGLTWAEAADDVLIAGRARAAGGMNVYYIGYNMDMAIEFIEACAMWARVFNQAAGAIEEGQELFEEGKEDKVIKTYTIRFESGFRIVALSSRPANLRGKQGVVVIDEAAFHQDLDELLKAAIALLMWGGKVRVISTHNGVDNPFNQLIEDIRAGKRSGSVHRTTFDEACAQ